MTIVIIIETHRWLKYSFCCVSMNFRQPRSAHVVSLSINDNVIRKRRQVLFKTMQTSCRQLYTEHTDMLFQMNLAFDAYAFFILF